MSRVSTTSYRTVLAQLEMIGFLLQSDRDLPSVAAIVAGAKIKGSWWGHKRGHEIFRALKRLDTDPDVMTTRLVSRKVTFLHRRLWPEFLGIATRREAWQLSGLSPAARRLFASVEKEGEIRMDKIGEARASPSYRDAAREIEMKLLVYSDEIHTERGSHAKVLMTWSRCPKIRDQRISTRPPAIGLETFNRLVRGLNIKCEARATLPWWAPPSTRSDL